MKYSSGISIPPSAGRSIKTQCETGCWCLFGRLLATGGRRWDWSWVRCTYLIPWCHSLRSVKQQHTKLHRLTTFSDLCYWQLDQTPPNITPICTTGPHMLAKCEYFLLEKINKYMKSKKKNSATISAVFSQPMVESSKWCTRNLLYLKSHQIKSHLIRGIWGGYMK